jgi:hypothetical protein
MVHKIQIAGSRRKTQNKKQDRHLLSRISALKILPKRIM